MCAPAARTHLVTVPWRASRGAAVAQGAHGGLRGPGGGVRSGGEGAVEHGEPVGLRLRRRRGPLAVGGQCLDRRWGEVEAGQNASQKLLVKILVKSGQ
jgi:hypothetical protein